MFLNIFPLILIYIFFFSIILSAGKFANDYILRFENLSLGEHGLIGFLFIYFLTLIFHFFISINDLLIYFFYISLIIFLLKNIKSIFNLKKTNFLTIIIIISVFLVLSITNNHHDDLYIFQLPIINYMQNHKIVFGLINLNDFIGQGHSFYEIMSFFKIPVYENRAYFLLPIIFVNFFVIFLYEILKNEKKHLVKYFIYFVLALLIIRFSRSKEYGTDLPILCLLFYIQINFFRFLYSKEIEFFSKSILASLFCIILKLYGILSIFYLLAFMPVLKKDVFLVFNKKKYLFFLTSIFLLTILKNIVVSGCLFYPISDICFDKKHASWSISKEIADKRNEFYNAQVKGWRSYTKNINGGNFISAKDYLEKNFIEKFRGLKSDKDSEKIITGFVLITIFILIATFSKNKIKIYKLQKTSNSIILILLFLPFLIWLIKFPQSRYGYFSYIACLFFYISHQLFNLGEINKKLLTSLFSILLIFLLTKNFSRIYKEINNNPNNYTYYPIKEFRKDDFKTIFINNVKFNIPINSFMECSNIPMFCVANENMIKNVKFLYGYYFLENNILELKQHIKSTANYDMVETNK